MKHYTDRAQKVVQIEKIENGIVHWDDGWVFGGVPEDVLPLLAVGDMYIMETRDHPRHRGHRNFSMVVGMATNTPDPVWLWRKTDEQLDQEHKEMVSGFQRRRQEELDKHREDWTKREAALPEPLRARLQRFRDSGGDFDRDVLGVLLVAVVIQHGQFADHQFVAPAVTVEVTATVTEALETSTQRFRQCSLTLGPVLAVLV
jgi:hypothetical protein